MHLSEKMQMALNSSENAPCLPKVIASASLTHVGQRMEEKRTKMPTLILIARAKSP